MNLGSHAAVITGAAAGIGRATAIWFRDRGWRVAAVDVRAEGIPSGVEAVVGDVAEPAVIEAAVAAARQRSSGVRLLVNNAVHRGDGDALTCRMDDWQQAFDVNVTAALRGVRAVLPGMLAEGGGCVVNVASVAGLHGLRRRIAYSATKGALIALSRQLALDYGCHGVASVCFCPGVTDTDGVRERLAARPDPAALTHRYAVAQVIGRMLTPDEVAAAIGAVVTGPAMAFNGAVLTLDGGSHLSTPSDSSTLE